MFEWFIYTTLAMALLMSLAGITMLTYNLCVETVEVIKKL